MTIESPKTPGGPRILESSPFRGSDLSEEEQILQNKAQKKEKAQNQVKKVSKARDLLLEVLLEELDKEIKSEIQDEIKALDFILQKLQNPKLAIQNPRNQAISKLQLEMANIHQKLDQLIKVPNQAKPTYAEIVGTPRANQPQSPGKKQTPYPPSPRVVIPIRRDLINQLHQPNLAQANQTRPSPKTNLEKPTRNSYRNQRLILTVPKSFLQDLNSIRLRDQINDQFLKKEGITKPVVAMVTKSASNLSLVITTMEDFSASYLVEKKSIWESYIPFSKYMYDKEWARLVVHLVPTSPFNHPEGLEMLKDEIETFNPYMKLMRLPQWLADEPTRNQKAHSSIVIHLENEAMATRALKGEVRIAGVACRAATYIYKHTQCQKCLKFGHTQPYCKREARCLICAQNHMTKQHRCNICQITAKECPHFTLCCSNCGGAHKADDKKCKEWEKVQPRYRRNLSRTNPTPKLTNQTSEDIDMDL